MTRRIMVDGKVRDATAAEEAQFDADAAAESGRRSPAARAVRIGAMVGDLFSGSDPETHLLARLLREIAIDMAAEKGVTPAQYRADLIARIS